MYTWTKELETGNALIDKEHKELFNCINKLLDACSKGHGRASVEETLKFLENYIVYHFNDEQALQLKSKYPDYENHRKLHEGYKKVVKDIAQEFRQSGVTLVLVGKVNQSIGDWLVSHIKREDVKVAEHLLKAGII